MKLYAVIPVIPGESPEEQRARVIHGLGSKELRLPDFVTVDSLEAAKAMAEDKKAAEPTQAHYIVSIELDAERHPLLVRPLYDQRDAENMKAHGFHRVDVNYTNPYDARNASPMIRSAAIEIVEHFPVLPSSSMPYTDAEPVLKKLNTSEVQALKGQRDAILAMPPNAAKLALLELATNGTSSLSQLFSHHTGVVHIGPTQSIRDLVIAREELRQELTERAVIVATMQQKFDEAKGTLDGALAALDRTVPLATILSPLLDRASTCETLPEVTKKTALYSISGLPDLYCLKNSATNSEFIDLIAMRDADNVVQSIGYMPTEKASGRLELFNTIGIIMEGGLVPTRDEAGNVGFVRTPLCEFLFTSTHPNMVVLRNLIEQYSTLLDTLEKYKAGIVDPQLKTQTLEQFNKAYNNFYTIVDANNAAASATTLSVETGEATSTRFSGMPYPMGSIHSSDTAEKVTEPSSGRSSPTGSVLPVDTGEAARFSGMPSPTSFDSTVVPPELMTAMSNLLEAFHSGAIVETLDTRSSPHIEALRAHQGNPAFADTIGQTLQLLEDFKTQYQAIETKALDDSTKQEDGIPVSAKQDERDVLLVKFLTAEAFNISLDKVSLDNPTHVAMAAQVINAIYFSDSMPTASNLTLSEGWEERFDALLGGGPLSVYKEIYELQERTAAKLTVCLDQIKTLSSSSTGRSRPDSLSGEFPSGTSSPIRLEGDESRSLTGTSTDVSSADDGSEDSRPRAYSLTFQKAMDPSIAVPDAQRPRSQSLDA